MTATLKDIPAAKRKPHADFVELFKRFPLRAIKTESDYDAAAAVLDRLAIRDEKTLSPGQADYLEALATLIEKYDDDNNVFPVDDAGTPLDRLAALMENRGMTSAELNTLIGSQSAASMVLNGKREISKRQAKKLAKYFRVDAGAFI
jgi:HTH-type transcriptional regulator/antitoxin HigA